MLDVDLVGLLPVSHPYKSRAPLGSDFIVTPAPDAPGQIDILTVTPGDAQNVLSWNAPDDGGDPITDYLIEQSPNGVDSWSPIVDGVTPDLGYSHTALPNDVTVHYRVAAKNSVGTGPYSDVIPGTPTSAAVLPDQPTSLTVTPGDTQNSLTWVAPADGGSPITDYVIEVDSGGGFSVLPDGVGTGTVFVHTGLTNNTQYGYRVSAATAVGPSPFSSIVFGTPFDPGAAPAAPANLNGFAASDGITLIFDEASSGGGSAIRGYEVELDGVVQSEVPTNSWHTNSITDGAHTLRVRTVNTAGQQSAWSNSIPVVTDALLPSIGAITMTNSITFAGATIQLDRAMRVQYTADGHPLIVTGDQEQNITARSPDVTTGPDNEGQGNGLMFDPNMLRDGKSQGWDEMAELGFDTTTRLPFTNYINPGVTGAVNIPRGAFTSLVMSLRKDQSTGKAWNGAPTRNDPVGTWAVFSFIPQPMPSDMMRPDYCRLGNAKLNNLKFTRNSRTDVLRSLTPPSGETVTYEAALAVSTPTIMEVGLDNGGQQGTLHPKGDYPTDWIYRNLRELAGLHSNVLTAQEKLNILLPIVQHGIDLEAIYDEGYPGRAGTIFGGGYVYAMYFAAFYLQDAAMLAKARDMASSETSQNRNRWVPQSLVGTSGAYPDANGEANQPFFPEHLNTPHVFGDSAGSDVNARYATLVYDNAWVTQLMVALLVNGPGGVDGIEAMVGNSDPIGHTNARSSIISTLDRYRSQTGNGQYRRYWDAWRSAITNYPIYEGNPHQKPKLGTDAEMVAITGGFNSNWSGDPEGVPGGFASAENRYSVDGRTWTVLEGQTKDEDITGLSPGVTYRTATRYVDLAGRKGIWSGNRGGGASSDVAPVYTVTPTGTPITAAPVNQRLPGMAWRPFLDAGMPYFNEMAADSVAPADATRIYPSVGEWLCAPGTTYRWKIRRNGVDVTAFAAVDLGLDTINWHNRTVYDRTASDFSTVANDTWLDVVIEADDGVNPPVEATSGRIYMPVRPSLPAGTLIDTQFGARFALEYPEIWAATLAVAGNTTERLSNDFWSPDQTTAGYLFWDKSGSNATGRIPFEGDIGLTGEQYRINAEFITGSAGNTRVSIRAGGVISEIPGSPFQASDGLRVRTITDYIHTVPGSADGLKPTFDMFLSGVSGGTSGTGVGLTYLKVEKL
ncbi:fibronectin type III domain-containing protein [Roseobacter sp.]|uniref:fibronectin type III domain-containing protein n=1 Tax=Roseobacter sp. TaxID=1907202 RepID=UPI0029674953|nr:fibronectin type III domain-containing protein [Roseobacter sp.]MDW3181737.1 fibronectin type III domain-containing protein [Roseobacter sp.]